MQATKFSPLDRVLVQRTDGDVDSWIVLHYLDGRVVVGCEAPEGDLTKHVPPAQLAEWQSTLAQHGAIKVRPASLRQLESAHRFALMYEREEGR